MSDKKGKKINYLTGSVITIIVVAMLVFMGPAQAVSVMISGLGNSYKEGTPIEFEVKMKIKAPDQFLPVEDISVNIEGPDDLQRTFSVKGKPISGDSRISITPKKYPKSTYYGYGVGCQNGICYDFGEGEGYGKGDKKTVELKYKIKIDTKGLKPGDYEVTANLNTGEAIKPAFSSEIKEFSIVKIVHAHVDFEPDSFSKKKNIKYADVWIQLQGKNYDADEIDVSSIRLNGKVPVLASPIVINGRELEAKFDMKEVKSILKTGKQKVTISGNFITDGVKFEGTDEIRVKN